jgi:hypothetical protein
MPIRSAFLAGEKRAKPTRPWATAHRPAAADQIHGKHGIADSVETADAIQKPIRYVRNIDIPARIIDSFHLCMRMPAAP